MSQLRRHEEPPAYVNPHFPRNRGTGAGSFSTIPENWPVTITGSAQHSWVITIALTVAIFGAGIVVFSVWHNERTAHAATSLSNH